MELYFGFGGGRGVGSRGIGTDWLIAGVAGAVVFNIDGALNEKGAANGVLDEIEDEGRLKVNGD